MTNPWALICLFLGVVTVLLIAMDVVQTARLRQKHSPIGLGSAMVAVMDANHRRYGGLMTHVGVVLIMAGVAGSSLFGEKHEIRLSPGQTHAAGDYTVSIDPLREVRGANYTAVETTVLVRDGEGRAIRLTPQTRFYDKASSPYSEIALYSTLAGDVYINLAGWEDGGQKVALQVLINPLTMWIWIGSVVLCLGATLALLPRLVRRPATRTVTEARRVESSTTDLSIPKPLVETSR